MQVTIKDVQVEWGGKAPKKWGKAVVSYEHNGSARKQNVMSFSNPEVFKKVQELVGETVDVEVGKNDRDFTEWRSVSAGTAAATTGSTTGAASTRVTGSNYETKDERAARQVLIVKQSSLSAAVATLTPGAKAALDPKAVLALAQEYADWVFETAPPQDEDIPF